MNISLDCFQDFFLKNEFVIEIEDCSTIIVRVRPIPKAVRFKFYDEQGKEVTMIQIAAGKKRVITAVPVDANGKPTNIDKNTLPVWTETGTGKLQIFPGSDGLSAEFANPNPILAAGITTVKLEADADTGAGETLFSSTLDVEVLDVPAGPAVGFQFTIGDEQDI